MEAYDRAIADYSEAVRLNKGYSVAFDSRANAYNRTGDNDRALTDYDEAIRLNPEFALAFNNRGALYTERGDHARAIEVSTRRCGSAGARVAVQPRTDQILCRRLSARRRIWAPRRREDGRALYARWPTARARAGQRPRCIARRTRRSTAPLAVAVCRASREWMRRRAGGGARRRYGWPGCETDFYPAPAVDGDAASPAIC
jgi:hypothetical protein